MLAHKYSFFKLRQSETRQLNEDLEYNYLLNVTLHEIKLSNTCLLIGINPRYEGPKLNLILRSRYLKGNFKIINISSLFNLTFPTTNISCNTKILKSLVEGNNVHCQELVNGSNPTLITNSEIFKREDSNSLIGILKCLLKYINHYSQPINKNQLNILNSTLNDTGFTNFVSLKTLNNKDLKNSIGFYFINNAFSAPNIKKLLSLKLLGFFQNNFSRAKVLITQSNKLETKFIAKLKKGFSLQNHIYLPNTVFFESSGTFLNTEGNFSVITKIVPSLGHSKSD
jgi:NADH dehydrogenase/NADH:ubiquinone oxidoreductase subunit G